MARKSAEPKEATREELIALVQEINAVLGLPEPIKVTKKMTEAEIEDAIRENAEGQIYESDFEVREEEGEEEGATYFSEAAEATLKLVGVEILEGEPPAQNEGEEAPEEQSEEKGAKKGGKKPEEKPKGETKKTKPAPKATEKAYSRSDSFADACDALKVKSKAVDINDLAKKANEFYAKNGGKDNVKESYAMCKSYFCKLLISMGLGEMKDDKFKLL